MCSTLVCLYIKYFSFVFICKYLMTTGLREQAFNVMQLWPGILKFSGKNYDYSFVFICST